MKSLVIFENKYEDAEKEVIGLGYQEANCTFQGPLVFSFMHRLLRCVLKANESSFMGCSLSSQMRLKPFFFLSLGSEDLCGRIFT